MTTGHYHSKHKTMLIETQNGDCIEVSDDIVHTWLTIHNMIETSDAIDCLPLSNVTTKVLNLLLQWSELIETLVLDEYKLTKEEIAFFNDMDKDTLFELGNTANYLNIPTLLNGYINYNRDKMTKMSAEQMREYMDVEDDFTEEEHAELEKELSFIR